MSACVGIKADLCGGGTIVHFTSDWPDAAKCQKQENRNRCAQVGDKRSHMRRKEDVAEGHDDFSVRLRESREDLGLSMQTELTTDSTDRHGSRR